VSAEYIEEMPLFEKLFYLQMLKEELKREKEEKEWLAKT